jgi:hypothetical protein
VAEAHHTALLDDLVGAVPELTRSADIKLNQQA